MKVFIVLERGCERNCPPVIQCAKGTRIAAEEWCRSKPDGWNEQFVEELYPKPHRDYDDSYCSGYFLQVREKIFKTSRRIRIIREYEVGET